MAPPKKKTKGNVAAVDCRNEELKEMDEECRNEVPKHPRNAWIFFYQEQCKLKDDDSLKPIQEAGDCGVHTTKYFNLEQFIEDELIMLKFSSAEGRIGLVLDLIMFEGNNVKEKIMEKAKKKYPSPEGKN